MTVTTTYVDCQEMCDTHTMDRIHFLIGIKKNPYIFHPLQKYKCYIYFCFVFFFILYIFTSNQNN